MTQEPTNTLATIPTHALPDENQLRLDIRAIARFQAIVRAELRVNHDYGVIPGTGSKPTLLKPGAEKITKLLGLADTYEIAERLEDWDRPLFRYLVKCRLISLSTGVVVSEGLGECNSMESKYRWRDAQRRCPKCQGETIIRGREEYGGGWLCFAKRGGCGAKFADNDTAITGQRLGRVENDDIYSLVNTILKMAKKRALVDAALSAGRLSDLFTQDLEDLRANAGATVVGEAEETEPDPRPVPTAQTPQQTPAQGRTAPQAPSPVVSATPAPEPPSAARAGVPQAVVAAAKAEREQEKAAAHAEVAGGKYPQNWKPASAVDLQQWALDHGFTGKMVYDALNKMDIPRAVSKNGLMAVYGDLLAAKPDTK